MERQRKGDWSFFPYEFLLFDLSNVKLQVLQHTKTYHTDEAAFLVHVYLCSSSTAIACAALIYTVEDPAFCL